MSLRTAPGNSVVNTWGVHFNMLAPTGLSVQCSVTRGTLDELAKGDGTTTDSEQIMIFVQHRTFIEHIACQKYAAGKLDHRIVVVGPDDLI